MMSNLSKGVAGKLTAQNNVADTTLKSVISATNFLKNRKKMANDNHLSSITCYNVKIQSE